MKRWIGSLCIAVVLALSAVCPYVVEAQIVPSTGLNRALELFIPIACTSPEYFRAKVGTGFPVGEHMVMTAKHIDCKEIFGPQAVTEISDDAGLHWVQVPDDKNFAHAEYDVRVYVLNRLHFSHPAKFRDPVLGEAVSGYGIAFGESADFGRIIKLSADWFWASSPAIGGMSGSALVADSDGAVVGMVVQGEPTIIGPGYASSWPSSGPKGSVLSELLDSLINVLEQ